MPMLSVVLRDHGPYVARSLGECRAKSLQRSRICRRAIDQGDHRGIAAVVQHLLKTYLKGTELSAIRGGIPHQRRTTGIDHRREIVLVLANHDDYRFAKRRKGFNGGGKKSLTRQRGSVPGGRPGEQRFVRAHARGLASGKDYGVEVCSAGHEVKIAEFSRDNCKWNRLAVLRFG